MLFRSKMAPREKKEFEDLMLNLQLQAAKTDYIAMMTDVDIPEEGEVDEQEV